MSTYVQDPIIKNNTFEKFEVFLCALLDEMKYPQLMTTLRTAPENKDYKNNQWHSVVDILTPYPNATAALKGYAFREWDKKFGGFSDGNLKVCYIPDEDFINDGRAFVLFNLIASNWTFVTSVDNQKQYWEITE